MPVYRPTAYYTVSFRNPTYAYDQNSATCASGFSATYASVNCIYQGFASLSVSTAVEVVIDWAATITEGGPTSEGETCVGSASLMASVNGGTSWVSLAFLNASRDRATTTYALAGLSQLSNLRIEALCRGAVITDPHTGQKFVANGYIDVYEIYVNVNGHSVVLSHTAPGTGTGKRVYASNLWDASAGTYGVPNASTAAIFTQDGTSGYWFLESYS